MELRQLRYFVAVAERLNFSKAARAVHVTQSTISHQISQLECELGYKLFERSLHHVKLTEQGEALLPGVMRALKDLDETIRLAKAGPAPLREHVRVLVSVFAFISWLLPGALRRFSARCPDVSIETDETWSNSLISRFGAGDYDFAVGVEEANAPFAFMPLCHEEMILAVSPDHPMAGRRRVRMIELHGERLALLNHSYSARLLIDRCFKRVGAEPQIVAEFGNPVTLLRTALEQGCGGIVLGGILKQNLNGLGSLVKIHLEDPTPLRTIGLYLRRDRALSNSAQILTDTFAEEIRDASQRQNDWGLRPRESGEQAA